GVSGDSLDESDLVAGAASGRVNVDKLDASKLPAEMRVMSRPQQQALLAERVARRAALQKEMSEVATERDAFLAREEKKNKRADGFDDKVKQAIGRQAARYAIKY